VKAPAIKVFNSENYNYFFDTTSGFFARWGKTEKDDPEYSPFGCEICDMEISTICHGLNNKPCSWCYKSNTGKGHNMSFETFKKIFHKLPKTLTQIAFGLGSIDSNKYTFKIFKYCRDNGIIPNTTISGWNLTPEYASKLANVCGAVSVSRYKPKDICYDAVKKLAENGLKFVNIHQLVSKETYKDCLQVMKDSKTDKRLKGLNAIVFLALKPKGDRNSYHKLGKTKYKTLIKFALKNNIKVGFDSCSAPMFLNAIKKHKNYKTFEQLCEPCESYLFSCFINVFGKTVPCSFLEDIEGYKEIDVVNCKDFLKDVWNNKEVKKFRVKLLKTTGSVCKSCRSCPEFDIY